MGKVASDAEYRNRVIDSEIDTLLKVCGAVCIERPKWCGKTWMSSHHSNSEFLVGSPDNNFSNRQLAEIDPTLVLQGDTPRMIDKMAGGPRLMGRSSCRN